MITELLNIVDIAAVMALIILPFAIIIRLCDLLWGEPVVKDRLNHLWGYLNSRNVTDFPAKIIRLTIRSCSHIFGNMFSCRNMFVTFFISCMLAGGAILVGRVLETRDSLTPWESLDRTFCSLAPFSQGFYQSEYLFPFKFICDYLMLTVTSYCMRRISERHGFLFRMGMIAADLFFASLVGFVSIVGIKVVALLSRNQELGGEVILSAFEKAIQTAGSFIFCQGSDFDSFLFGVIALLPIFFYLLLLLIPAVIIHVGDHLIHKIVPRVGERFLFVKVPVLLSLLLLIYSLAEIIEWLARRG